MQRLGSWKVKPLLRWAGALKFASIILTGLLAPLAFAQAPANDNFANAQTITGDFGSLSADTTAATAEVGAGEPSHAGRAPSRTVWYKWVSSSDLPVEFDTFGSAINTVMAVYTGTTLANLDYLAGNDDINDGSQYTGQGSYIGPSGVKFNARRGTTYYIVVGSFGAAGGQVRLNWAFTSSGVFRFSSDTYLYAETDGMPPSDPVGTIDWCALTPVGGGFVRYGARVTVTRLFGAAGKCIVNLTATDGTAVNGTDYILPAGTSVIFDDYEISKSVVVPLIDDGGFQQPDRFFTVDISGVSLDPDEDPTVISPPRIDTDHSTALINEIDFDGPAGITNACANFERFVFRTREDVGTVRIPVWRLYGDPNVGVEVHYAIDSIRPIDANTINNTFALQAGSDYAAPDSDSGRLSLNVDFDLNPPDNRGTLSWGPGDYNPKYIEIPIHQDGIPEFNEDFFINLYAIAGHSQDLLPFQIPYCWVTILYYDYPAGALDDTHNRDFDITTDPPLNTNPGTEPGSTVYSLLVQADNKTVIAGNFGSYNTIPSYGIARMNVDGSADQTFNPGDGVPVKDPINPAFITCMAAVPGGKIVLGGKFPSYNGVARPNVAEINGTGALDMNFNPGLGANGTVWAVAVQTNAQVLIAGEFTTVNGYPRPHIARLNTDGSLDMNFDPGPAGPNRTIYSLALAPDGSVYIGGAFSAVGGLSRNFIALLNTNGVVSTNFAPVKGVDGPVYAMALQNDGRLLIGGSFSMVELRNRRNIARYNANGTLDTTFDPGTGADDTVNSITLQPDGRIFLGGTFNSVNQTRRMCVARLYRNGEVDTGFMDTAYNQFAGLHKPYLNPAVDPKDTLWATALQNDGNLVIGGSFHFVGGGRFTTSVETNSIFPCDFVPWTRAAYRIRNNVTRLLGGDTGGPGSIGFIATNYTVLENMGYLYVKMSRQNGYLGQIEATFSAPGRTDGPGVAKSGVDYIYQPTSSRRGNPRWDSALSNVVRAFSDCMFGTNNVAMDIFNHNWIDSLEDIYVTILDRSGFQGDRSLPFKLDMPSSADVFFLAGENIPLGAALSVNSTASLRVQETDVRPGVIGFSAAGFSVNENGTNAVITITRTNGSTGAVSVRFATTNGTAVAGIDYVGVTNTVTFRDGEVITNTFVPIINGTNIESADKTINLYLQPLSSGAILGTLSNAVLSVVDDDFAPGRINFATTTYSTNEEAGAMVLVVTRSGGNVGVLDIQYASSNLTAVAGDNYLPVSGSFHWDDGDTTPRLVTIPILHDRLVTANRQFIVTLFNPSVPGSPGSRIISTNTIVNTDFYGTLQFSATSYNVSEQGGYATITVTRTGGSAETVSASFRTADGTAFDRFNYLQTNGSVIFGPGEVSKTFAVRVLDDGVQDPAFFVFNVLLSSFSPTSAAGTPATAQVKIVDAQSVTVPPGQLDTAFKPDAGFDNDVFTVALQPDGKIVAGGSFTIANGLPVNRISRLNLDGTLDQGFLTSLGGANDSVRVVINQTDTRMVLGGDFTIVDNVARNHIARMNYDGSLDTGFNPGSGADGVVYALAETFDFYGPRKVLVGGAFNTFSGVTRPGVVRLNDDGTVDTAFNTGIGVNGTVFAIAVYPTNTIFAGKTIIGGEFTAVNGLARNRIARLNVDGSLDLTFDPGAGADATVRALAIEPDGSVLLGGAFTNVNGSALSRIARLRGDGSVDPAFQPGVGANDLVYALALQPDNRIVVGGGFTRASGTTRNRLTRLMPDGQVDPTINFGTGANDYVASIAIQPDGKLVIVGGFTQVQDSPRAHLARLYGGSMTGSGSFRFSVPQYQVAEDATNIIITVLRTGGTSGPNANGSGNINVSFFTTDGTARAGVNYTRVSTTLSFPPGETMQSVVIPVKDDPQITPDLTVNLSLVNPTPPATLGAQPTAVLSILNVEGSISFSSQTYSRAEDAIDGAATIEFRRVGSTRNLASVQFSTTTNGTAIPNVNYTPVTNAMITFAPGQAVQTYKVPIFHTPVAEGDTTVGLLVNNPLGALLVTPSEATLTIIDVDSAPGTFVFSATNYVVGEGDGFAVVTVVRTNGRAGDVSVVAMTVPGDATPGLKYIPTNYAIPFANGEVVKSFAVPILEENQVEGNQSLFLLLTNATGGTVIGAPNPVPLTIIDDDVGVSFATNSALNAVYVVSETNTLVTIDIYRLNAASDLVTTVSYFTTNGTALAGVDYAALSGTLTFNRGESQKSVSILLMRNPRVTGDLTFALNLSNPTPGVQIAPPISANVVINDVDSGLSLLATNAAPATNAVYSVRENGTNIVITVVRTNANTGPVAVTYATADGTAVAPIDYVAVSGTLVFTNGQLSNSFSVPIIDNNLVDGDRYFTLSLLNPTAPAQLLAPSSATVNIIDNETGFRFSNGSYEVAENGVAAVFEVRRVGFTNGTASVAFATQNGTARAGTDYTATNGVLVFTNSEISKSFAVGVLDNTLIDGDRTVLVSLSNPLGSATLVNPSAATLTIHDNDGSLIIPAGSALIYESGPTNQVIDPGETNTLLFAFRNSAGSNTVNLTATLLATNGVIPLSPPQGYGVLVAEGPSVSRPFTFTSSGTNGQRIVATFQLTDLGRPVSTNSGIAVFTFTLGTSKASVSNPARITINDDTTATPYPAVINAQGIDGVISKVTVGLSRYYHGSPADVDVLLMSPDGLVSLVMANAGSNIVGTATLTFDDGATNVIGQFQQVQSGAYKPSVYYPVAGFPVPAPPAPTGGRYPSSLAPFNGSNPNGLWSLFVIDDTPLDSGYVSNGWSLNFTLVNPVNAAADVGITMSGAPESIVLSSNVTYTINAVNYGPGTATGVRLTNIFPANSLFVSASSTVGTFVTNGTGALIWTLGDMTKDSAASLSLTVLPTGIGAVTNSAIVGTRSTDLNPDDDAAAVITTVIGQTADLALSMFSQPEPVLLGMDLTYTVVIANLGPGSASAVALTDRLPSGVALISATPAAWVLNGTSLTFTNLGTVGEGEQAVVTIVVRPLMGETITNIATCVSPIPDPFKLNNNAAVKSVVETLAIQFQRVGNSLTLSWPAAAGDLVLESTTDLQPPVVWTPITQGITTVGGQKVAVITIGGGNMFFRLRNP
ncbi:MAG TPA: Calx-beta domain-containing protein [Verrucomicrobiae bacterium]